MVFTGTPSDARGTELGVRPNCNPVTGLTMTDGRGRGRLPPPLAMSRGRHSRRVAPRYARRSTLTSRRRGFGARRANGDWYRPGNWESPEDQEARCDLVSGLVSIQPIAEIVDRARLPAKALRSQSRSRE